MQRPLTTTLLFVCSLLFSFYLIKNKTVTVYLIGDSTVADYSLEDDYETKRFPMTGWGQVFQAFMHSDSLAQLRGIIKGDSVVVEGKAVGGRSTRTFFEEGRWAAVYESLRPDDIVMMQFGHNDAAKNKPERYVNIEGYKQYLRLFVNQARQKGAIPVIITPVSRNSSWKDGKLSNMHGEYPQAAKDVAKELDAPLIDLTQLSMDAFSAKGKEYVSENYFMNLPAGKYEAYPEGLDDNTHFQPEGAEAVARLVFEGMKKIDILAD